MSEQASFVRSTSFWDRTTHQNPYHANWMADPRVRDYINSAFGHLWPFDWFQQAFPGRRFPRALSIGCGTGALERDLVRRGLSDRVDALDGSIASLAIATAEAKAEKMDRQIRYMAADFNEPALPASTYDAIFFHQSLHHVAKLEKLLRATARALKPGGMLYLDEYIGPSRDEWNDGMMQDVRAFHASLDPALRVREEVPLPIQEDDPSEAIRSGEIMQQLEVGFRVDTFKGYGGNVLTLLYPEIHWDRAEEGLLDVLIERDRAATRTAQHFCAVVVAHPKRGLAGALASARYFVEPKVRRIRYELLRRIGREPKF